MGSASASAGAAPHTATSKASGSFAYYCLFHPFTKGTIVVE